MTMFKSGIDSAIAALSRAINMKFALLRPHPSPPSDKSIERARKIAADRFASCRKTILVDNKDISYRNGLIGKVYRGAFVAGWMAAKEDENGKG